MLTSQRKQLILTRLQTHGQIVAKTLSLELGTSEDTIRRDLRELASLGKLQRVHGGALPSSLAVGDTQVREHIASGDKEILGRWGASLMKPGQVIMLDGGTTAMQVVVHIDPSLRATVVTHSPMVATALAVLPHIEVIMLGGKLFRHSMVNMGAQTVASVMQIHIDLYFMGVTGVHPEAGLTTADYEEAAMKRVFHSRSAETVVLASSEKLLSASACKITSLEDIASLAVAQNTADSTIEVLGKHGAKVQIVK
jgi:DeoR/GlpR family transcriptional regulator of sugar metabolism